MLRRASATSATEWSRIASLNRMLSLIPASSLRNDDKAWIHPIATTGVGYAKLASDRKHGRGCEQIIFGSLVLAMHAPRAIDNELAAAGAARRGTVTARAYSKDTLPTS